VGAALRRALYRGELVWGRTAKRDMWGKKRPSDRPQDDWIRRDLPGLRIVSDELWEAAQERRRTSRHAYLRHTDGKLWGRPCNGIDSKYLLTGMSCCDLCGGALTVRHSKKRGDVYSCLTYQQRGLAICANNTSVPRTAVDAAVLGTVETTVLRPDVIRAVVEAALTQLRPTADAPATRERVQRDLAAVGRELHHLGAAIATTGALPSLVAQVQTRESQRERLQHELAELDQVAQIADLDLARLEREVHRVLDDWRGLLTKHVAQARQILGKLIDGRLRFRPEGRGFIFEGTGRLEPILSGTILPKAVVAPTGFEPVFQP
jgi:site-specific DNA recombinase